MKRSTFSSRSKSKSKDRCDDPNECAGAFRSRSRSRSLNRSTISSRRKNRIGEVGCSNGGKEGTNESQETKSGAARSGSRGRVGDRSSSMLLMPCMRGGNNQATDVVNDSNNEGNRCRSRGRNR